MTLAPETESEVIAALAAVQKAAEEARNAPDLAAAKAALNRVWFVTHRAQNAINEADDATRKAALARLETARAFA